MQILGSEEGTKGADCRDIGTDKTEFVLILGSPIRGKIQRIHV